ncbi:MAG: PAS domain-containing protein [Alphaproteobacteria bacterium]
MDDVKIQLKSSFDKALVTPVIDQVFSHNVHASDLPKTAEEAYESEDWAILFGTAQKRYVQYANKAAQEVFGYPLDEFIGLDSAQLAGDPEERAKRDRLLTSAAASGDETVSSSAIERVTKQGNTIVIENPQVITLEDGRQGAFFKVSDVSSPDLAEPEL